MVKILVSTPTNDSSADSPKRSASVLIAVGIMLSRLAGLIREAVFAAFLPLGAAFDAFAAAIRIPNVLQMLLGEGTLSASFIPVYADCLLYTSPSPRDATLSRMPSSA